MTDNFLDLFQQEPPAKPKATPGPVTAPVPVVAVIPDEPDTSMFDGLLDEPAPPTPVSEPECVAQEFVDVPEPLAMEEVDPAPAAIEDEVPSQDLTPEPVDVSPPAIDPVVEEENFDQEPPVIGYDLVVDASMSLSVVLADAGHEEDLEAHGEAVATTQEHATVPTPNPSRTRLPVYVGAGVGLLVISAIAWWTLSSNKESTTHVAETGLAQPVPATPDPVSVTPKTEPVAPMPAAIVDDIMGTTKVEETPVVTPTPQPAPEPAVVPEPTPEPKPVTTKREATGKPAPKSQPKPAEKSWQDDALDQLDNLEKRL